MTYFRREVSDGTETLVPEPRARSGWGGRGQIRGTAVSGVLARAAERVAAALDDADAFRPVRWTVDLFRPAALAPTNSAATVVRSGRRIRLVDATLTQDGVAVARGTALLLRTGGGAGTGRVWAAPDEDPPEVPDLEPGEEAMLYFSDGVGWSAEMPEHQNGARKRTWHLPEALVDGEKPSPFVRVATVADSSNLVGSWGSAGIEFINPDLTLTLTRLPDADGGIGLVAEERREDDGIAVLRTSVVDRWGPVGSVLMSTLANGAAAVDFGRS
ncbi:acyl-CoA thioesterase domain-containing protein [Pseudonocardia endophytica]|uniref:Thioesterase superfamily protein n=1 Tax=Pseudonocardia endophytica TaxID=401976 RepID=A0A4R1HRE4_PSEEN|nr:acyl-CoA thioesterase domain-containing protein [Pseudonocardia endophytica]TCK22359.1 thioesterase superfamily protein [Pseudonocardia endophytica]